MSSFVPAEKGAVAAQSSPSEAPLDLAALAAATAAAASSTVAAAAASSSSLPNGGTSSQASMATVAAPSQSARRSVYDRSIASRTRTEVSLSAFSFVFSEMVQYNQGKIKSVGDLEHRLEEAGYSVGQRVIEYIAVRDKSTRRSTRVVNMLQYICNVVWKFLFNKAADGLERSFDNEDEYMIQENSPLTNTFVSLPQDFGKLNCAAYLAGVIAGILDSSHFNARVTAHLVSPEGDGTQDGGDGGGELEDGTGGDERRGKGPKEIVTDKTVFLVKFSKSVMDRERAFG